MSSCELKSNVCLPDPLAQLAPSQSHTWHQDDVFCAQVCCTALAQASPAEATRLASEQETHQVRSSAGTTRSTSQHVQCSAHAASEPQLRCSWITMACPDILTALTACTSNCTSIAQQQHPAALPSGSPAIQHAAAQAAALSGLEPLCRCNRQNPYNHDQQLCSISAADAACKQLHQQQAVTPLHHPALPPPPGLRYWRHWTPGSRWRVTIKRDGIWSGRPKRSLVRGMKKMSGRNNRGRITVRCAAGLGAGAWRQCSCIIIRCCSVARTEKHGWPSGGAV